MSNGFDADEILDLVDENDQVIRQITRGDFQDSINNPPGNIRGAAAFIINSSGELWIPRRIASKRIMPSGLDYSVAEHVGAGESYDEAIVRGFEEELNMTISIKDLSSGEIVLPTPYRPLFIKTYIYRSNEVPNYSRDDYCEYQWIKPRDVIELLQSGKDIGKSGLISAIEMLFL